MKIIYIHGMGKQLPERSLKGEWDLALFEKDNPDTSMAYYADVLHPEIAPLADDTLIKVTDEFTKMFTPDVNKYLFDEPTRTRIQARLVKLLDEAKEPVMIVSHSLGTIIAYEVLCGYEMEMTVPLFITIGAPLGIEPLKAKLRSNLGVRTLTKPWCVKKWYNFADPLDIVAADKSLADEYYGTKIKDFLVKNKEKGVPGLESHSIIGYLQTEPIRKAVNTANLMYRFPFKWIYNLTD